MSFRAAGTGAAGTVDAAGGSLYAFRRLTSGQQSRVVWVVELDAYVAGSASPTFTLGMGTHPAGTVRLLAEALEQSVKYRASDLGYATLQTDPQGVVDFPCLLREALTVDRAFNIEPHQASVGFSWGDIIIENPDARWDAITQTHNADGRTVRVWMGVKSFDASRKLWKDPAWSTLIPVFAGAARNWFLGETELRVPVRDMAYLLERPWQSSVYTGGGAYTGTSDLTGKPVPKCRGWANNVTPVLVDPTNRIYQYTDAAGQVVALYERGKAVFTYDGDTSDLYTGSTPSGRYRTDNSRGLFQLGAAPAGPITCDVKGSFPLAGFVEDVVDIARYVLTEEMGLDGSLLEMGAWTGLAAACPYAAGVWTGAEVRQADDVVGYLLGSIGASLLPNRPGRLRPYRLSPPSGTSGVVTYTTAEIVSLVPVQLPATIDPPNYRRLVGYARNYTVQTTDLDSTISEARRLLLSQEYSYAGWSDGDVLTTWRNPTDPPPLPTALKEEADAQAVAEDFGALWGTRRRLYDVTMWLHPFAHDLGDDLSLVYPMDDLRGGKPGIVVSESIRSSQSTVTLRVLV